MSVELTNESDIEIDTERVLLVAEFARDHLKLHPMVDVGIMFINEAPMTDLHVKWMDEPGPTDVLSFPMDELRPGDENSLSSSGILGDIVVCPQVAALQADAAGHEMMNEILMLVTHGMLHLVGFDHAEPLDETQMFGLQREILEAFYKAEAKS